MEAGRLKSVKEKPCVGSMVLFDAFFNGSKTVIVSTSWLSFTTIINDREREIEMPFCLACESVYESWRVLLVVVT